MTTRKYSSRSQQTTLTGAITSGATSMTVVSGTALLGGVTIPSGTTFTLVIDVDTALEEIVDATAVSTNTFTITRAIDGSSAQDHSAGAVVRHMAIGRDYRDANTHTEADSSYNDGSGNAHTMHGIAAGEGVVVGTLKTQTLTNKTLTAPTISDPTITGTVGAGSLVFEGSTADAYETTLAVTDPTADRTITLPDATGNVVLDTLAQTLSNKTLGTDLNAGGFKITNLATPTNASDAVRKDFADAQVAAAATSAASAATSAASAATSASSASTSASSALTSANSASTSATAAATSATSAAASATAAATSATSAAASATAAATSAASAATSAASAAAVLASAIQNTIIDAKGDLIVGSAADTAARLAVGTDGYLLTASSTAANGVTWAAAPVSLPSQTGNDGKVLVTNGTTASWSGAAPVAQTAEPTTLIDGLVWVDTDGTAPTTVITRWSKKTGISTGTTVLSGNDDESKPLSYTPGYEQVFVNGVLLSRTGVDYTATSGTSITLASGLTTGDIVEVICASQVAATDTYTQGQANSIFYQTATTPIAGKNKIINGDFRFNQRNFTSNTASVTYNFDRWRQVNGGATGTLTVTPQTFTPGTAPVSGYEAQNFVQCVTASGASTGTYAILGQPIEDVRTLAGQTATISFWAKAGSGTPKIAVELEQEFGTGGSPSANVTTYAGQVTLSTSWARYSVTVAVPSISGKTLGTNANSSDLLVSLWLSSGSDFNSRNGSLGLQNNTFQIWGVQVEAGSVATQFTTASGTIQGELALCQRYYWRTGGSAYTAVGQGNFESTTLGRAVLNLPVSMRVAPTSLNWSNIVAYDGSSTITPSTIAIDNATGMANPNNIRVSFTVTGATAYRPFQIWSNNNTAGYLDLSAEL